MRVLMVIDSLVAAGAQKQLTNLAVGLARREHEVIVYIYHPKHDFLPELEAQNIRVVFGTKKSRFDPSPLFQLFTLCRQIRPDVVVSFLRTPSVYCEIVRLIYPTFALIVSERNTVVENKLSLGDLASGIFHIIADRVTSNSNDYRNHLVRRLPFLSEKMSVIYNGTDSAFFKAYQLEHVRVSPNGQIRLMVIAARCVRSKGALIIAEALHLVRLSGRTNMDVHWVGRVDFHTSYVKSVVEYLERHDLSDNWRWEGLASSVVSLFPEYDALVSPSLREGIANVMCESMAAGLPVIASDVSDNRTILEDGKSGLIFEANNAEALAQKLIQFLDMQDADRRELANRAHQRATELFSTDRFVDEWEHLCQTVARNSNDFD